MAPAAAQTLIDFVNDSGEELSSFDLIVTGDLGQVGADLFRQLLLKDGISLDSRYNDCGLMLFDRNTQDVHAGGSGCGCSAAVLCSYIASQMNSGAFRHILFLGTGALMSTTSSQQGNSIPGIAHAVSLCI